MKIVVLLSRVPYPLIKGDKLRAFNQIKQLSRRHDIYLCSLNDSRLHPSALSHLEPFCKKIEIIRLRKATIIRNLLYTFLFTEKPLQTGYFFDKKMQKKILSFIKLTAPDHLYCQLIRTTEYVKDITHIPKTLDYMDSLSSGMQRRAERAPFYLKWLLKLETKRLKSYEHAIFESFENKTIISESDRKLIVNYRNDSIRVIENGVDEEVFKALQKPKKYDLLFTGNMSYPPNVECVNYLISEVMPLVWKTDPAITLAIAGANPSRKLKQLASDRIIFSGWVEDICEYYNRSRVFIAPMQIGSGLQNKLLEAMSMRIPCITSALANQSLKATDGQEIMIGKNSAHYAQLALDLLGNPEDAERIANQGKQFVRTNFDWEKSVQKLNEIFEKN